MTVGGLDVSKPSLGGHGAIPSVEKTLLSAARYRLGGAAIDNVNALADEEMKVVLDYAGCWPDQPNDDPAPRDGEYIGATLIEPDAAGDLAVAPLEGSPGAATPVLY